MLLATSVGAPCADLPLMHPHRMHCVETIDDLDTLAEAITQRVWPVHQAFRWRGLLFLNDATCDEGAQEYAVYEANSLTRLESLTCSWMSASEFKAAIHRLEAAAAAFG